MLAPRKQASTTQSSRPAPPLMLSVKRSGASPQSVSMPALASCLNKGAAALLRDIGPAFCELGNRSPVVQCVPPARGDSRRIFDPSSAEREAPLGAVRECNALSSRRGFHETLLARIQYCDLSNQPSRRSDPVGCDASCPKLTRCRSQSEVHRHFALHMDASTHIVCRDPRAVFAQLVSTHKAIGESDDADHVVGILRTLHHCATNSGPLSLKPLTRPAPCGLRSCFIQRSSVLSPYW